MNLLEIGKILRPHGIKGAVKVESYLDEPYSNLHGLKELEDYDFESMPKRSYYSGQIRG